MTADAETNALLPAWLPHGVLCAIREGASERDPARAALYTSVDAERVRRAIDRGDDILAAQRCYGDDDVADVVLARAALIIARAMIQIRSRQE